jgi:hypothetical protein
MGAFVSRRALTAKARGRLGGKATAESSTPEFLEDRATKAGCQTRDLYGRDFYRFIQKRGKPKRSAKQVIKEVIEKVIPLASEVPSSTVDLMQAAAKAIVK